MERYGTLPETEGPGHSERGGDSWARRSWLLGAVLVLAFVASAWFLRQAGVVLAPITFAFFVALVIYPLDARVREHVRPRWRWLGPAAAMAAVLAVLIAFGTATWLASAQVAGQLPRYAERIDERAAQLTSALPFTGDATSLADPRTASTPVGAAMAPERTVQRRDTGQPDASADGGADGSRIRPDRSYGEGVEDEPRRHARR